MKTGLSDLRKDLPPRPNGLGSVTVLDHTGLVTSPVTSIIQYLSLLLVCSGGAVCKLELLDTCNQVFDQLERIVSPKLISQYLRQISEINR